MEVLTKAEVEKDPTSIGEKIAELAYQIEDVKGDLSEIKDRNVWQRLINNNTKDLAVAMIKQNDTISAFLTIVQGIIFLCMTNIVILAGIMDSLKKQENTNEFRDNKYIHMATDYLSEAIKAARKSQSNEKSIIDIKNRLNEYYKNQEEHKILINNLIKQLSLNTIEDEKKAKIIASLKSKLSNNINVDREQSILISKIKDELLSNNRNDKRRSELIASLKLELERQSNTDYEHSNKIEQLERNFNKMQSVDNTQNRQIDEQIKTSTRHVEIINKVKNDLIKNKLEDKKRDEIINNLYKTNNEHNKLIYQLQQNQNLLEIKISKQKIMICIGYTIGIIALILSVIKLFR